MSDLHYTENSNIAHGGFLLTVGTSSRDKHMPYQKYEYGLHWLKKKIHVPLYASVRIEHTEYAQWDSLEALTSLVLLK